MRALPLLPVLFVVLFWGSSSSSRDLFGSSHIFPPGYAVGDLDFLPGVLLAVYTIDVTTYPPNGSSAVCLFDGSAFNVIGCQYLPQSCVHSEVTPWNSSLAIIGCEDQTGSTILYQALVSSSSISVGESTFVQKLALTALLPIPTENYLLLFTTPSAAAVAAGKRSLSPRSSLHSSRPFTSSLSDYSLVHFFYVPTFKEVKSIKLAVEQVLSADIDVKQQIIIASVVEPFIGYGLLSFDFPSFNLRSNISGGMFSIPVALPSSWCSSPPCPGLLISELGEDNVLQPTPQGILYTKVDWATMNLGDATLDAQAQLSFSAVVRPVVTGNCVYVAGESTLKELGHTAITQIVPSEQASLPLYTPPQIVTHIYEAFHPAAISANGQYLLSITQNGTLNRYTITGC